MNAGRKTLIALTATFALVTGALLSGCSMTEAAAPEAENTARSVPEASGNIPEAEPVARVASQVQPSVVQINVESTQETPFGPRSRGGIGSGVIYRTDGYIITNAHVVRGADTVSVAFADGSTERGQVVGSSRETEIAVVKVDRDGLPAAKFADSGDLLVGQLAVAIGSPEGFESTVSSGVVSGISREFPPELTQGQIVPSLVDLIQTDAAISPGSSGGALANRSGEIIGINVAYLPPAQTGAVNIGFAIPSDTATPVADQLIETGEVSTPFIGVRLADLSPEAARRFDTGAGSGAIVAGVEPGSAAADAGVRREDIITALGGEQVENTADLLGSLRGYRPGDTVELSVVRDGDSQTLPVTLGEAPRN